MIELERELEKEAGRGDAYGSIKNLKILYQGCDRTVDPALKH